MTVATDKAVIVNKKLAQIDETGPKEPEFYWAMAGGVKIYS